MMDISEVNLSSIDLNLLQVVATVLETRSATRAAAELHVTQSAVSNALKRARELFDDPLLERRRYGFEPTPRGAALLPELRAWLDAARHLIATPAPFDPATTARTFHIACADAITQALLRPLLRLLTQRAPRARLRVSSLERLIATEGLDRGEVDLLIGIPPEVALAHEAEEVYLDPMVCLVRRGHEAASAGLSLEHFAALPHVEIALFGASDDTIDRALARRGLTRQVQIALPHFSALPLALLESDGVCTLSRRLAESFAAQLPLTLVEPPLELEPLRIVQVWHRRWGGRDEVLFLRQLVLEAAQQPRAL